MLKKLLVSAVSILMSLLLASIGLEFYCRHTHIMDIQRGVFNMGSNARLRFRKAEDTLLGYEHRPCPGINVFGNYDRDYSLKKPKGTFRILVLGDSITEAGGYVKRLEYLLNSSGLNKKFEVWNCGVGGYGIKQYWGYLESKGSRFSPDMIIVGFCLNDFDDFTVVLPPDENGDLAVSYNMDLRNERINGGLFVHSNLYRYILFLNGKLRPTNGPWQDASRQEEWALKSIISWTDRRSIPLETLIFPYFKSKYSAGEKKEYNNLKTILDDDRVRYTDLHGVFASIDDLSWRANPGDFIHPSIKGHVLAADTFYKRLMDDLTYWYKIQPD